MLRMRLMRRSRRSCETAAVSARPMASPISSARERMREVIVYGGLDELICTWEDGTGRVFKHPEL